MDYKFLCLRDALFCAHGQHIPGWLLKSLSVRARECIVNVLILHKQSKGLQDVKVIIIILMAVELYSSFCSTCSHNANKS